MILLLPAEIISWLVVALYSTDYLLLILQNTVNWNMSKNNEDTADEEIH